MKSSRRVGLAIALALLMITTVNFAANRAADDPAKRVKIVGGGVEFVGVTSSAEKCGRQKDGEAIRLRVTSESPVDVRMYMLVVGGRWISKDFPNQKKGDE